MTQEQIREKELFLAMVDAITNFKLLKDHTRQITNLERDFIAQKIDTLDPVVKAEVEREINLNAAVQPIEFTRVHVVDPDRLPDFPMDLDDNTEDLFKFLKPRR